MHNKKHKNEPNYLSCVFLMFMLSALQVNCTRQISGFILPQYVPACAYVYVAAVFTLMRCSEN